MTSSAYQAFWDFHGIKPGLHTTCLPDDIFLPGGAPDIPEGASLLQTSVQSNKCAICIVARTDNTSR